MGQGKSRIQASRKLDLLIGAVTVGGVVGGEGYGLNFVGKKVGYRFWEKGA